jgi:hypothetical protein
MRNLLLAFVVLGLGLGFAGSATALPVTVGPVTVSCTGFAVSVTLVPPGASVTPPTCTVGLPV